jgi:hypothetical protein
MFRRGSGAILHPREDALVAEKTSQVHTCAACRVLNHKSLALKIFLFLLLFKSFVVMRIRNIWAWSDSNLE